MRVAAAFSLLPCLGAALLLKDAAMVMTHDAATGYLQGDGPLHPINAWTKTQEGGWDQQIKCGARAFDVRAKMDDGKLIMHHGDINVDKPFADALKDAINAAASVKDELIVAVIDDCSGDGCQDAVRKAFADQGVPVGSCSELSSLQYADALKQSRLPNNASVRGYFGCLTSNWDSAIGCYKPYKGDAPEPLRAKNASAKVGEPRLNCGCYDHGDSQKKAFSVMDQYIAETTARTFPQMWQLQVLWQETTTTVVEGTLCGSSLVKDTQRSALNSHVLPMVAGWKHLNFLEINDVCNPDGSGLKLAAACKARNQAAMAFKHKQ